MPARRIYDIKRHGRAWVYHNNGSFSFRPRSIQVAPSYSGGAFEVVATNVLNNKNGLMFWGTQATSTPFQGGTKCVAAPVSRTPTQDSGGNAPPNDCSGSYSFNFSTAYMAFKGLGPGITIYCQYWSRDPTAPFTTGLTDGLQATICQ